MNRKHELRVSLVLALALSGGCASTQSLSVHTDPGGAEVYLQRRGEVEVQATVAGVHGQVGADSFEEEYFSLGTSPVEYEFHRKETEAAVQGPGAGGSVTRHFREGTIRVELEGYRTVERRVRFSGDAIVLRIALEQAP